jgi:zinc/manganese transport system substrate-binding protein
MAAKGVAFVLLAVLMATAPAAAQSRLTVIASFSILGDLVKNVGGDRVEVATLVGPNGNTHVYEPSPADSRRLADAAVIFVNGLGFEGWLDRLAKASGTKAPVIVASTGIRPRARDFDHSDGRRTIDPHAWQSVANAKIYVGNIRDVLIKADPAGQGTYSDNATAYLARLTALEKDVTEILAKVPTGRRHVVTSHDAFGYFGDAYGIAFTALQGVATEAEPSARDVARIIEQIQTQKASAVFLENIVDPRLIREIARETGAKIGGTLYSDALTDANGPAPSYIDLIRHNAHEIAAALGN